MTISVVLPTHNRARSLGAAMASVLAQTHRDLELIVVDDGSTDDTRAVVEAIQDLRVRFVRQDARGGVSRARNRGVELATGDWVAFQDSDDEWLPEKLAKQLAAATADTLLVVTADRVTNEESLSYAGPASDDAVIDLTEAAHFRLPPAATWLARRSAIIGAGGFDPALDCYEDWELGLRLAGRGKIRLVNEALVLRTRTAGSLFSDESSRLRNLRTIVERHRAALMSRPAAWAYYCNGIGQMEMQAGNASAGRRRFRQALTADPLSPRTWANLLMSLSGRFIFAWYVGIARRIRKETGGLIRIVRSARP